MGLWHYTCEHGRQAIERDGGVLRPQHTGMLWLTDLDVPFRDALGLTSHILDCDRTEHRYRVLDHLSVLPWIAVRRTLPADYVEALESTPGAMPMHWFVSIAPVRAELADAR